MQNEFDIDVVEESTGLISVDGSSAEIFLGIDIGGTNTKIGLVNKQGMVGDIQTFSTQAHSKFKIFIENLLDRVNNGLLAANPGLKISGIGVGAPNANYKTGEIENPSNLSWGTVNIADKLNELFCVPVSVNNDANAAAMGEKYFGVAKNMENFILLTLGTGLGGGIVVNGSVVTGDCGHAGEVGHVIVKPDGRQCGCGRRGCLETYVSTPGLRRSVFELLSDLSVASELRGFSFEQLRGEDVTQAAADGDMVALQAFEMTGKILGIKLADLAALLNPEAIILAGGLMNAGDYLMDPVKRYLDANLLEVLKGRVKILRSGITIGNLAVLGASAYAMQNISAGEFASEEKKMAGSM